MGMRLIKTCLVAVALFSGAASVSAQDAPPPLVAPAKGVTGDIIFGDAAAPVEIIEYASMTCGHCAHFMEDVFPTLQEKYLDTGKARVHFRNFVLNRLDMAVAIISRCKVDSDTKGIIKTLFANQQDWLGSRDPIGTIAIHTRPFGLNRLDVNTCFEDRGLIEHLAEMTQQGQKIYNVSGTPTIIVNGKTVPATLDAISEAVDAALE